MYVYYSQALSYSYIIELGINIARYLNLLM